MQRAPSEISMPLGVNRLRPAAEGGTVADPRFSRWLAYAIMGIFVSLMPLVASVAEPCGSSCSAGNISLAVVAPIRGQPAETIFGAQASKSVELAVRDLNTAGGILGRQIELRLDDDGCDPALATVAANRHVDRGKPSAVIGPICPASALAVAPVYGNTEIPEFLPTASTEMLSTVRLPKGGNIFSMVPTDEQEARALADHLEREHPNQKLAVVYADAFYRNGIVPALKRALPAEMQKSARFEPLLDISGLYERLADQLQRQQPDVVYLALNHDSILKLLSKMRQRPIRARLIGGHHLLSYSFWLNAQNLSEGIHVLAPISLPTTPEFSDILARVSQAGATPDMVALNSYASVQIWADAVRRTGSVEPAKVAAVIRQGEFATAVGPVAFDQQGNRRNLHYSFLTWRYGRPRFVDRRPWVVR